MHTRLFAFAGGVALLHAVGWGLYFWYSRHTPALAGLGILAYTFGLRGPGTTGSSRPPFAR
jgi:nickel/cobalt transporter (NiCoT) family protein